ncbi:MAG: pteridine-dependent deoxygenase, partial [Geminicoccaceae bacterium]
MPLQLAVETTGDHVVDDGRTLAWITFGKAHRIDQDQRSITIGQPALLGPSPIECWQSARPVEHGWHREIAFASDGRFLFGHILLEETPGTCLETPAHHAYTTILNCLDSFGGLHLLRIWNVVDAINETQEGLERYRSFCVGRSRAFADRGFPDLKLPAASGVGSEAPGLMISFIAATDPGRQIENPRQVSAFRYPRQHGPKSPSFSRALIYPETADDSLLFISGTASIVGHETVHVGSLEEQFEETCRNVDAVMAAACPD